MSLLRRGAGVVDRDGLENRCAFTGTVGSNPTLSAKCSVIPSKPLFTTESWTTPTHAASAQLMAPRTLRDGLREDIAATAINETYAKPAADAPDGPRVLQRRFGRMDQNPVAKALKPPPLSAWLATRDLPPAPRKSFRAAWKARGR